MCSDSCSSSASSSSPIFSVESSMKYTFQLYRYFGVKVPSRIKFHPLYRPPAIVTLQTQFLTGEVSNFKKLRSLSRTNFSCWTTFSLTTATKNQYFCCYLKCSPLSGSQQEWG
jgi:hypothetical protein